MKSVEFWFAVGFQKNAGSESEEELIPALKFSDLLIFEILKMHQNFSKKENRNKYTVFLKCPY